MAYPGVAAVILAAGKGTRMRSERAKVLHPLGGRPLIEHVLATCVSVGLGQVLVVVGHDREAVIAVLAPGVQPVVQEEQRGTGHAVLMAELAVACDRLLVLCGDAPLVSAGLLRQVLDRQAETGAVGVAVAAIMDDPTGYGRMLRDAAGDLAGIVEERDADPVQRRVTLVNAGIYVFRREPLFRHLQRLRPDNAQGEYYLTDVVRSLAQEGERIPLVIAADADEVLGINTPGQLAQAEALLRRRAGPRGA